MNISVAFNQNVLVKGCPLVMTGEEEPRRNVTTRQTISPMSTHHPILPAGTRLTISSPLRRVRMPCHTEYAVTQRATASTMYISQSITSAKENWWTAEDKAKFDSLGRKLVAQFSEVEVLPGVHANGEFTLGENIGDHGGLSIAYTALENALNGNMDTPVIDGFTPKQRFYLSYGNIWAQNITDQEKARLTNLDPHSLAVNRVNVSVRNFQTFFDAFDIQEGDPMYRPEEERVHIW